MKKTEVKSEIVYIFAIVLLALAVAILSSAGFGVSMVVAPAYILSQKTGILTFGQAEYVIQSVLFCVFCCVMKKFKPVYLSSFITCLVYGAVLTSFSIALFFKTYLYPQVYDFFVKGVSEKFGIKRSLFKTVFDLSCLAVAVIMSLCFFKKFVGVNFGTLIIALFNGTVIGFFSKILDKHFEFKPFFKNFAEKFSF